MGRFAWRSPEEKARAVDMGTCNIDDVLTMDCLVNTDEAAFIATGVTDGEMLRETDALGDRDAEGESDALGDSDGLTDGETDGETEGLTDALGDNEGLTDGDADGDTDGETPRGKAFSPRRAAVVILAAVAVIAGGSWLLRAHPIAGYRAGYDAAIAKGEDWVRDQVDKAGGQATTLCTDLYDQADQLTMKRRYDHFTFYKGCGDAVDHLYGRHVPMRN